MAAIRTSTACITAIEAIPYAIPFARPAGFASGTIANADNVLVRVRADAGPVGQAEAQARPYTYGETQASIVRTVQERLAPRLIGLDPLRTDEIWGRTGDGGHVARGALDLAVWDLAGKLLGRSCHAMLGGAARDVAAAHMVSFGTPEEMAEDALRLHDRLGVCAFKVKVGRAPELDVASMRAIRDALPDADLYCDANRGWSFDAALRAGDELIGLGARSIEEPVALGDRDGRIALARRWPVPVVGDESCISLSHVAAALDEGAIGTVSIKTARTGFSESRRILELCRSRGVPVVIGSQYEGALGAAATISFAAAYADAAVRPAEVTNFLDLADDLVVAPPAIRDGRAAAPTAPGLGVEIDDERLRRYRVDV